MDRYPARQPEPQTAPSEPPEPSPGILTIAGRSKHRGTWKMTTLLKSPYAAVATLRLRSFCRNHGRDHCHVCASPDVARAKHYRPAPGDCEMIGIPPGSILGYLLCRRCAARPDASYAAFERWLLGREIPLDN